MVLNELDLKNLPSMTVNETVELLGNAYIQVVMAGVSPKVLPSVMLWGPPGVGKSQAIRQIAKKITAESGKRVNITDVRLLLFNPIDLRGIPVANEEHTLAVWLKPKIFQMDSSEEVVNILFLDEISAAPQSVQAAAYQLTLDRMVGEHKLPDNCIVIAAGNRVTDKSVSVKMPKALANRLLHIEVEGDFDSWKEWAIKSGVNDKVIGFLSLKKDCLFGFDAGNDDLAFSTPRSWEMVSNILNNVESDPQKIHKLIAGLIGNPMAYEFEGWCNSYKHLPNIQDIFEGKVKEIPKRTDVLYTLVNSMTSYAFKVKSDSVAIGNSIAFARKLPSEFGELLIENYCRFDTNYKDFLMKIPEYVSMMSQKGKYKNGRDDE